MTARPPLPRPLTRALLILPFVASMSCGGVPARNVQPRTRSLDALATGPSWQPEISEGERSPAFYVGGDVFGDAAQRPRLPRALAALAAAQLTSLAASGVITTPAEVELWPSWDAWGRPTWVIARSGRASDAQLRWVDLSGQPEALPTDPPRAIGAELLDPAKPADRVQLFTDALAQPSLYALPAFTSCVWTTAAGEPVEGWLCRRLPPPARNGETPIVFHVDVNGGEFGWGTNIEWTEPPLAEGSMATTEIANVALPTDFAARLLSDVRMIDGEADATFTDGARQRFTRRSAALPDHQLNELVRWLEQRYAALGVHTERVPFEWRGIAQANLIAMLPGELTGEPIILADHLDTAFAEDTFAATGARVPVPGGDDNALATATLLAAADLLRSTPRHRPIWLVHLTGEEYPSDDLGARQLVTWLVARGTRPYAWVQLDMIGWRKPDDCVLQFSPSDHPRALGAAALAARIAQQFAPSLCPAVRPPGDVRSYLYNTDSMTAATAGIPTFLINEHVNVLENIDRHGYHDTGDVSSAIDAGYAAQTAATALVTAATLAR